MENNPLEEFIISEFGTPQSCGVYAVIATRNPMTNNGNLGKPRVLYIGSAVNMNRRVSGQAHPYKKLYNRLKDFFVCVGFIETKDYINKEIELIKKYRPLLNKQHK